MFLIVAEKLGFMVIDGRKLHFMNPMCDSKNPLSIKNLNVGRTIQISPATLQCKVCIHNFNF